MQKRPVENPALGHEDSPCIHTQMCREILYPRMQRAQLNLGNGILLLKYVKYTLCNKQYAWYITDLIWRVQSSYQLRYKKKKSIIIFYVTLCKKKTKKTIRNGKSSQVHCIVGYPLCHPFQGLTKTIKKEHFHYLK